MLLEVGTKASKFTYWLVCLKKNWQHWCLTWVMCGESLQNTNTQPDADILDAVASFGLTEEVLEWIFGQMEWWETSENHLLESLDGLRLHKRAKMVSRYLLEQAILFHTYSGLITWLWCGNRHKSLAHNFRHPHWTTGNQLKAIIIQYIAPVLQLQRLCFHSGNVSARLAVRGSRVGAFRNSWCAQTCF